MELYPPARIEAPILIFCVIWGAESLARIGDADIARAARALNLRCKMPTKFQAFPRHFAFIHFSATLKAFMMAPIMYGRHILRLHATASAYRCADAGLFQPLSRAAL